MSEIVTSKTSSPCGDLISFLAGLRQVWMDTGKKSVIYHRLGMIGGSYVGAEQPYEDENRNPICFNQYTFDMMRPLVLSQEYVEDYLVFDGQKHEIDFDKLRLSHYTNQPLGSLNRHPGYVFPQMITDLSEKWVIVPQKEGYADKIILNFTLRNRNTVIHYHFLKNYKEHLLFAGLPKEHNLFCKEWGMDIPLIEVNNFYELATILNGCKFLLGNQSFCMQLCEAMKVPRILECFPMMPTHIVIGKDAIDFYHQEALEFKFHELLNKKNEKQKS